MLLKVKVFPGSKKQEIIEKSKNNLEIRVKEKPIQGKVNKRLIFLLSLYFKTEQSKIRLIKGFRQKNKIFEILE
ncbi:MAG: DUF167 family protein [Patescibacteria group bacterium]|nr:DUF167 family protein [Patescibacteria group bacterium]